MTRVWTTRIVILTTLNRLGNSRRVWPNRAALSSAVRSILSFRLVSLPCPPPSAVNCASERARRFDLALLDRDKGKEGKGLRRGAGFEMEIKDGSRIFTGVRQGGTDAACRRNCGASAVQCCVALILTLLFVCGIAYASSLTLETVRILGITTTPPGLLYGHLLPPAPPAPPPPPPE